MIPFPLLALLYHFSQERATLQLNVSNLFRIFTVNLNRQTLLQRFFTILIFFRARPSFFFVQEFVRILRLECFCRNLEIGHRGREKDAQERWQVTLWILLLWLNNWITFATTKVALDLEAEPTYSFVAGLLDG